MRVRSTFAAIGLATVTMMWGAPVALASEAPTAPVASVQGNLTAEDGDRDKDDPKDAVKGAEKESSDQIRTLQPTRRGEHPTPVERNGSSDDHNGRGRNDDNDRPKLPVVGNLPNVPVVGNLPNLPVVGNLPNLPVVGGVLGDNDRNRDRFRDRFRDCDRDHRFGGDRDRWFRDCDKGNRDRACGCDSDRDRDWFRDCDRDHRSKSDRDRHRWYRDCDKHRRDRSCGCDSDRDHDGKDDDDDDDKDSKKDHDSDDDKDTKGGSQTSEYPKGAPETGGGPVDDNPLPMLALGLTGLIGAGLAGAGALAEQRSARR